MSQLTLWTVLVTTFSLTGIGCKRSSPAPTPSAADAQHESTAVSLLRDVAALDPRSSNRANTSHVLDLRLEGGVQFFDRLRLATDFYERALPDVMVATLAAQLEEALDPRAIIARVQTIPSIASCVDRGETSAPLTIGAFPEKHPEWPPAVLTLHAQTSDLIAHSKNVRVVCGSKELRVVLVELVNNQPKLGWVEEIREDASSR